jgi:hypothetical protein
MSTLVRRAIAVAALSAALITVGGSGATASHTPDGQPLDRDFVTGEVFSQLIFATTCCFRIVDVYDVSSGPAGESPTGTVRVDLDHTSLGRSTRAFYDVTCLEVDGNRATIGGAVRGDPDAAAPFPQYAVFAVEDGGGSGPDRSSFAPTGVSAPPTCPPFSVLPLPAEVVTGDLTVHDATELPSRPGQCLAGGWRRYGFETLGRCLAFVVKARVCEILEQHGHHPAHCPPTPPLRFG